MKTLNPCKFSATPERTLKILNWHVLSLPAGAISRHSQCCPECRRKDDYFSPSNEISAKHLISRSLRNDRTCLRKPRILAISSTPIYSTVMCFVYSRDRTKAQGLGCISFPIREALDNIVLAWYLNTGHLLATVVLQQSSKLWGCGRPDTYKWYSQWYVSNWNYTSPVRFTWGCHTQGSSYLSAHVWFISSLPRSRFRLQTIFLSLPIFPGAPTDSDEVTYTYDTCYTLQWLEKPDLITLLVAPNDADVTFKKYSRNPKPSDLLTSFLRYVATGVPSNTQHLMPTAPSDIADLGALNAIAPKQSILGIPVDAWSTCRSWSSTQSLVSNHPEAPVMFSSVGRNKSGWKILNYFFVHLR